MGEISTGATTVRKRPALFRALGDDEPPDEVAIAGTRYRLETVYKHDSWAATAVYVNDAGTRAVCKFNRRQSIFGFPMGWLGGWLAGRESAFLKRLADVDLVPDDMGGVSAGGKHLRNAVARSFVDGTAFRDASQANEQFFKHFRHVLDSVHERDMAYVDLHKRENVIVGADGRPHLVDFQVCYGLSDRWPGNGGLARRFLKHLQELDDYHYRKHFARCLPHLLSEEERRTYLQPTRLALLHRRVAKPLRTLRRRLLVALRIRDESGHVATEYEPEVAFRSGENRDAGPPRKQSGPPA